MIDQLSTILFAATPSKTSVSQELLEVLESSGLSMNLGESPDGIEAQALFMHLLQHQQNLPVERAVNNVRQQFTGHFSLNPPGLNEEIIVSAKGQELPSAGNRFPLFDFNSTEPNHIAVKPAVSTTELAPSIERVVLPLTAVNRTPGSYQVHDQVIDLRPGFTSVEQPVSSRVLWMVSQNIQAAELRVNPPQLGPVEVRISVEGDQTNVSLIAQHAAVREVMETAIPRLREMLAESGLNLANIDVSQHDLSQRQHDTSSFMDINQGLEGVSEEQSEEDAGHGQTQRSTAERGLIDYFV